MDMLVAKNTPDFIKHALKNFSFVSKKSAAETSAGAAEWEQEALADAAERGDAWPRGER